MRCDDPPFLALAGGGMYEQFGSGSVYFVGEQESVIPASFSYKPGMNVNYSSPGTQLLKKAVVTKASSLR